MSKLFSRQQQRVDFKNEEDIQAWLVSEIARRLRVAPEKLDVRAPFTSFGLDSRNAIALSGDLERVFGREFSPTLVWDYPTIESLASHLIDPEATSDAGA